MREHSYRDYLTWMAWLDEQWEMPSRTDHYLMQIAMEIRREFVKQPPRLEQFKIPFTRKERVIRKSPPVTQRRGKKPKKKQVTQQAKRQWLSLFPHLKPKKNK